MNDNIQVLATDILSKYSEFALPINVKNIVQKLGIILKPFPLGDDVSGVLSLENGKSVIIYNSLQSKQRRRFTIAHELGHYILHRNESNLFVDSNFKLFRSNNSSDTPHKAFLEQQANLFAASILMPKELVEREIEKIDFDFSKGDESLQYLSKLFNVSSTAMYYRLFNLGLLQN